MNDSKSTTRIVRGCIVLLAAAGIAAGVWVVAAVPPSDDSYYPRCQLHYFTGLHCPGCGTTRAAHALLNGEVLQALAYNALAFLILPIVGWSVVKSLYAYYRGERVQRKRSTHFRFGPFVLVILLILYAVLRNIPVYPFTLLAPHQL